MGQDRSRIPQPLNKMALTVSQAARSIAAVGPPCVDVFDLARGDHREWCAVLVEATCPAMA